MTAEQKAATAATSSTAAKPTPEQGTEWIICRVCGYIEDAKYRVNLVQHVVFLQQFGWITSHVALIQNVKNC